MSKTIPVSAHARRQPEKAPDPFAPVLEAKRAAFCRKWNVDLIGANDDRLAAPVSDPATEPGRPSLEEHGWLFRALDKLTRWQ